MGSNVCPCFELLKVLQDIGFHVLAVYIWCSQKIYRQIYCVYMFSEITIRYDNENKVPTCCKRNLFYDWGNARGFQLSSFVFRVFIMDDFKKNKKRKQWLRHATASVGLLLATALTAGVNILFKGIYQGSAGLFSVYVRFTEFPFHVFAVPTQSAGCWQKLRTARQPSKAIHRASFDKP